MQGNVVIEPRFGNVRSFRNGLAVVQTIGDKWGNERRLGVIDREGNDLVEPNLDFVGFLDRYSMGSSEFGRLEDTPFYSGLLGVRIPDSEFPFVYKDGLPSNYIGTGKWGYVRKTGGYAINPRFRNATNFSEERAVVDIDENDVGYPPEWRGKGVLIDTDGKAINTRGQNPEPIFSLMTDSVFKEGIALAQASNDRYGFIDRNGRWVIQPVFSKIRSFSEGLAAAKDVESGKWGYLDRQGRWVIRPQFGGGDNDAGVSEFSQGLVAVQDATSGKWGYLNQKGELIVSPQFDRAEPFQANGLAYVQFDKKYGLIDRFGNYLFKPQYELFSLLSENLALVRFSDKEPATFITTSGKLLPYNSGQPIKITEGLIAVSRKFSSDSQH